jgi:hypothetical protein
MIYQGTISVKNFSAGVLCGIMLCVLLKVMVGFFFAKKTIVSTTKLNPDTQVTIKNKGKNDTLYIYTK